MITPTRSASLILSILLICAGTATAYSAASFGGRSGGYGTSYAPTQNVHENDQLDLVGKRIEIGMIGYAGRPTPIRGTVLNETKNTILLDKEQYVTCGCTGNGNLEYRTGKEWINKGSTTYIKEIGPYVPAKTWKDRFAEILNWRI